MGLVKVGETVYPKIPPDDPYPPVGATGDGLLATITFTVKAEGATLIHFEKGRHELLTIVGTNTVKITHEVIDSIFDNRETVLPPVASFDAEPLFADVDEIIVFNASASDDLDAWLVSYEWDFGDTTTEIYKGKNLTAIATHAYDQGGNYTVKLNVTDYDNLTDTATKNVTIRFPDGNIAGRVTDASEGYGIEGATVEAGGYSTFTNSWGYYSLEIDPGTYNITASAAGYISETKIDIVVYSALTTIVNFTLAPIPQTGTLSISTIPLTGEVFVNGTSWGLAPQSRVVQVGNYNVSFAAVTGYYTPNWQLATVLEDAETTVTGVYTPINGTLTVNTTPVAGEVFVNGTSWGVAPQSRVVQIGTYNVSFGYVASYYTPTWHFAVDYRNSETIVEGVCESVLGAINGTITDASTGSPVTAASITADGYSATTDSIGYYIITDVPAGTYTVTASLTGYLDGVATGVVVAAGETTQLDFSLTRISENGTIYGKVTDISTGDPIAGATVSVDTTYSTSTDSSGIYTIDNVSPGDYTVTATATNYYSDSRPAHVESNMTTTVDFALEPVTHTLTVDSSPISGVNFTVDDMVHTTPWSESLMQGSYTIEMPSTWTVGADEYVFAHWEDDSTEPTRTISLTEDTTITATYELYVPPSGWIEGIVTDAETTQPIAGAAVTADNIASAITNESGYYNIEIEPGIYTVTTSKAGYETYSQTDVTVVAQETVTVDFELKVAPLTIDIIIVQVEDFYEQGEIDELGIQRSLTSKLYAAKTKIDMGKPKTAKNILNAFINHLKAQSGKHVSEEAANILIAGAQNVINSL